MTDTSTIRRRPDGSIDTNHYGRIAHQVRSATLVEGAAQMARPMTSAGARLRQMFALLTGQTGGAPNEA